MNTLNLIDNYVDCKSSTFQYYTHNANTFIDFNLNDNLLGLNVAIINAGSVAGRLFAGSLCDRYGRRSGILTSAIIALVVVAIQASATHEAAFCIGRFLLGVSITVNGTAAPV
jgi:MFS family permease